MNIDQAKLMLRSDGRIAKEGVYAYTNQVANEAFVAGYNGIIFQSTKGPGRAVVLFDGRYDPQAIQPIIDLPLP